MKKVLLNLITITSISMAFSLDSITSSITDNIGTAVTETVSMLNKENTSKTTVDLECKNPIDNYEFNYHEALKILAMHSVSNSSQIMRFLSGEKMNQNKTSLAIKELASKIAKNTFWIPVAFENVYGQFIFEKRKEKGDVIDRTTKNAKYKKMYKVIDAFTKAYKEYLIKHNYLETTGYPFDIKVFITSNSNQAEAIPGGFIFISEDYIKDNRYATVLVHELTHVAKRHITKELQFRLIQGYDSITQITEFIEKIQDTENATLSKVSTALAGKDYILKQYSHHSQEQELEADSCSLKILTSINHANSKNKNIYTQELIKNIEFTIQNEEDIKDKFLTIQEHPNKEERIQHVKKFSKSL